MLADFQQALADLVASPQLCREVRANPATMSKCYRLTALEFERLVDMANQQGMRCNCTIYRANRLALLALNLHDLCIALGDRLTPLVNEFWQIYPDTHVNFLVECDRFCEFLISNNEYEFTDGALKAFEREYSELKLRLAVMNMVL